MPPKKKPRRDISGLTLLTTDSSHTNELISCRSDTAVPPVSPDPSVDVSLTGDAAPSQCHDGHWQLPTEALAEGPSQCYAFGCGSYN